MVDDLGYNDLTFAGGGVAGGAVPTPNIDSIARDGIQFTRGYTGNATCSPSRAAILTGRYPTRYGFEFTPVPKEFSRVLAWIRRDDPQPPNYFEEREKDVPPLADLGVPPSEITLAELLRERGYHTLGLGKWHLGEAERFHPTAQGFDEYLGFLTGASMFLDPGRSERRELEAGLRSDRSLPLGESRLRRLEGRRPALRARRLHDRLPRARGGERDRRQRESPLLPLSRLQRAPHAAPGPEERLRRAPRDRGPHAADLRRDDPRPRSRRRPRARRAARERPRGEHPRPLHERQRRARLRRALRPERALSRLEDDLLRRRRAHALLREMARTASRWRPIRFARSPTSTSSRRRRGQRAPLCPAIA